MGGNSSSLKVANYAHDKVYLFNLPSTKTCVSPSASGLKLESWLRLKQIQHETIRSAENESSKDDVPFIEYNGREYRESTLVIKFLTKELNKEDRLSPEQQALARVITIALDNRTAHSYTYYQLVERPKETMALLEFLPSLLSRAMAAALPSLTKKRLRSHGIGRNSPAEIYQIGCDDLMALSKLLGNKKFLLGDEITTVDCCAFGHLAQILYLAIDFPHRDFIMTKAPNLSAYADRVKEALWPDWESVCAANLQSADAD